MVALKVTHIATVIGYRVGVLALACYSAVSLAAAPTVTAQQFVDLQQGDSEFPGFRRAHAKGICIAGEFNANGNLSKFSQSDLFAKGVSKFIGRFSIAGNNPYAPDLKAPVRSLALTFVSGAERFNIAMNTPPVMAVSNPHSFYQQLVAIKQGAEAIQTFFAEHPESADFLAWKRDYQPTSSLATETYHSINAFYLVNEQGQRQAVRWQMTPLAKPQASQHDGKDALQNELAERLLQAPVKFAWQFTLAEPSDDENDPAKRWPADRTKINAGTITIEQWQPQLEGPCHGMNFDPLVLPTGVAATADPILRARSAAYAESYRRRAKEQLFNAVKESDNEQ